MKAFNEAQHKRIKTADAKAAALPPVSVQLITIKQCAEILAMGTRTIETMLHEGQLNSVKIRGARRLWLDEIQTIARHGLK